MQPSKLEPPLFSNDSNRNLDLEPSIRAHLNIQEQPRFRRDMSDKVARERHTVLN